MAREFERALPGKIGVERMMRIVMTAILKTPTLALCEPQSFFGALLQALQLGLEVNTPLGQAYLIPRKKKDRNGNFLYWECNFQLGYQGLLELCYRYGKYKRITAEVVYEGDYFEYQFGTMQRLAHIPNGQKDAKPTHVWALYELENGGERFVVWTWDKAMSHGEEFSDSWDKNKPWQSPWLSNDTSQEEMAKKSVLKSLLKTAPKSVELKMVSYTDGNVVIADKFDDDKGSHLRFDVKQIEAPSQDAQDAKNFMDQVNTVTTEGEKETVPASNGNGKPAQATTAAPPQGNGGAAPGNATAGKNNTGDGLFRADEGAALQEAYERDHPNGPVFN
jgi:recombination protein RecT